MVQSCEDGRNFGVERGVHSRYPPHVMGHPCPSNSLCGSATSALHVQLHLILTTSNTLGLLPYSLTNIQRFYFRAFNLVFEYIPETAQLSMILSPVLS